MNRLLIIGKQRALIEAIAHRFSKEGFDIVVISDNLQKSNYRVFKDNLLDDKKYEYIFKRNLFNVVIYLDYFRDINKIIKILKFSSKYKVKNFIRVADLIGENDTSSDGLLSNDICNIFKQHFNIKISTLNVPILYGEGTSYDFIDKNIFIIMNNLMKNKKLSYDNEVRKNYLHINDASEATYLTYKLSLVGIYDIPSRAKLTLSDLDKIIQNRDDNLSVILNEDIFLTSDFSKITGFKEKYYIIKELPLIYEKYKEYISKEEVRKLKSTKYKKLKKLVKSSKPYIENIVLFILVYFLSKIISPGDSIFSIIDIKLVYIISIGVVYGSKQSLLSTFLACSLLIWEQLNRGISIVSILILNESLVQLLTYVLVGIYVGYSSDFKNMQIRTLNVENKKQEDEYEFLEELYNKTYDEKIELEEKVISSNDSFGKIYSVVKELDSLEPQYILKSSIDILEKFLNSKKIAIYTLKNDYLRLNVKSSEVSFKPANSVNLNELKTIKSYLQQGNIFVNRNLDLNIPMMVSPIKKGDKVIAIIMIEELDFSKMSLYYENLFMVISKLIESSIIRAYDYEDVIFKEMYVNNTIFLRENKFNEVLETKRIAKFEKKLDYTLLKLSSQLEINMLSQAVKKSIRETDIAGVSAGNFYVLLTNTSKEQSYIPIKRLKDKGVHAIIMDEVESYD